MLYLFINKKQQENKPDINSSQPTDLKNVTTIKCYN